MNWSSVFCMFGMALTRPSLTMQLKSGMDVFAHACWQKADTSSNYCDNIQPYDKRRLCFCQMLHDFQIFFWKLPQFHTSNFCRVVWQHTEVVMGSVILVLLEIYLAFQHWKNFENPLRIDNVIATSVVDYFFGTQCTHSPEGDTAAALAECALSECSCCYVNPDLLNVNFIPRITRVTHVA